MFGLSACPSLLHPTYPDRVLKEGVVGRVWNVRVRVRGWQVQTHPLAIRLP